MVRRTADLPLTTAALALVPSRALDRLVALLMRGMRRQHPKLFSNFGRLDTATIQILPADLPHRFAITYGNGSMTIRVLPAGPLPPADASIRARLAVLIDMLEGRIDGDAMFFTRDIEITGSTEVIVAVRNTLDREEIVLRDDIVRLFGPLERPARRVARGVDRLIFGARARLAAIHDRLHEADAPPRDFAAECDALRAELAALKTRIAKLDVKQQRTNFAATGVP
jgi:predicted lipid carrier protein YhbT